MRKLLTGPVLLIAMLFIFVSACATGTEPTTVQPAAPGEDSTSEPVPIKLAAKRAEAERSVLSAGEPLSCVRVTVTNQTSENLEVNPLYFSITDRGGTKHDGSSALGMYEGEIDATTLAPNENAKGMVCAEGDFRPAVVAMTSPLMDEVARAEVR